MDPRDPDSEEVNLTAEPGSRQKNNTRQVAPSVSLGEQGPQPSDSRLGGHCGRCHGLIVYSDDNGKTWRHYDGTLHKGHEADFMPDASVLEDLPKKRREHSQKATTHDSAQNEPTEELKAAALSLAKDPALLYKIKLALDRPIFREDANKLLLFLICLSSLTLRPLSAGITSESAAGKSRLLHSVIAYFPNVDYFTRITPASMDRLANNLTGRILVVEELRGADAAQGTIRVAISEGKLRLLTTERDEHGKIITREIETKGTPVFLTTTTSTVIDWESQTRFVMMSCDESSEQTRGVLEYEAAEYNEVRSKEEIDPTIPTFLTTLLPHDVLIPFARQLVPHFPADKLSARRDFKKLLNLVALIAFVHQHQRLHVRKKEQPLQFRIVATPLDLQYAFQIAGPSLQQNLAGVPSRVLLLLQFFKEGESQTTRSIAHAAKISQRTARRWLGEDLVQAGYLAVDETGKEHLYYLKESESRGLSLEMPPEVLYWDLTQTCEWLEKEGFEIRKEAPEPTYVDPFTGNLNLPKSFARPLAESQSKPEIPARIGQTAENAARPQTTANSSPNLDADNGQLKRKLTPTTDSDSSIIEKLRGLESAPTLEHYVDYAATILKDTQRAKALVERLHRERELVQGSDEHWSWRLT